MVVPLAGVLSDDLKRSVNDRDRVIFFLILVADHFAFIVGRWKEDNV